MKVAIIGAGLAGTSLGYVLSRAGAHVKIYEASDNVASGASGNALGLINPRIAAHRTPQSDFYISAFAQAVRTFNSIEGVDWNECGSLHLITDEKREKRYHKTIEHWAWPESSMRIVSAEEASAIAGVDVDKGCLYLPQAGYVSPKKLCEFYARSLDVEFDAKVERLSEIDADAIVIACGMGSLGFKESGFLPLTSVRGQVTMIKATEATTNIKTNLCYGGYLSAPINSQHMVGSTFQRWLDHRDIIDEDDQDNLNKLRSMIPSLADENFEITAHRASLRTAAKDHFPVIGHLQDHIYISTAHGSHGIISSLAGAHLIADMILDRPRSQSQYSINALSPDRFRDITAP